MKAKIDYNFLPAIKCPYCNKLNHPEISGFGGELSTRIKFCRHCEKEYRLLVYSFADKDINNTTYAINNKRKRIEYLKKRIEKLNNISNEATE